MRRTLGGIGTTSWLRAAVVLGLIPLATGTSIFLLWLLTRWDWLMVAGILTVCGGVACVTAGLVCLIAYAVLARRRNRAGNVKWRVVAVAFLLLVNFPVAGAVTWGTVYIETLYTVEVRNGTSSPVDRLAVSGGGVEVIFEDIPPGASRRRRFHVLHDGSLTYRFRHHGEERHGVVEGYVTNSMGGHRVLLIEPGGEVTVLNEGS